MRARLGGWQLDKVNPPQLICCRALKCSGFASKYVHGFCWQYKECLGFMTSFKATQEENEYNWKILMLLTCFGVRDHKGNGCLASVAAVCIEERVCCIGCSPWGKLLCLDLGLLCKRSNHRVSGNSSVREAFNSRACFCLAYLKWSQGLPVIKATPVASEEPHLRARTTYLLCELLLREACKTH